MSSPEQKIVTERNTTFDDRRERESSQEGFDVYKALDARTGPFIEIAGPTEGGYAMVDFMALKKQVSVSNKYPGLPLFNTQTGDFMGYDYPVDFQADAENLPMGDRMVGAIFCSNIGTLTHLGENNEQGIRETKVLREKTLRESYRVLEDGGLLIWQGGTQDDIEYGRQMGFNMARHNTQRDSRGREAHDIIFVKSPGN